MFPSLIDGSPGPRASARLLGAALVLVFLVVPTIDRSRAFESAIAVDVSSISVNEVVLLSGEKATRFTVDIADDPVERARGLMFIEHMPRNHGMLFDYGTEGERTFWMKNTPLPLDLIFARSDGSIISIKQGEPFSETRISSDGPAHFVLEVNAGVADELGLVPGDRLLHPRIRR
jgi:hypothetical protein